MRARRSQGVESQLSGEDKKGESMTTKAAKQQRLPGTEDPEIEELHDAAFEYAGIRDQRMALTPQETGLKQKVLALMKKYKKQTYNHNGV